MAAQQHVPHKGQAALTFVESRCRLMQVLADHGQCHAQHRAVLLVVTLLSLALAAVAGGVGESSPTGGSTAKPASPETSLPEEAPWRQFLSAIEGTAKSALAELNRDADWVAALDLQVAAEKVYQAVLAVEDPKFHTKGEAFGVKFATVVWPFDIRPELQPALVQEIRRRKRLAASRAMTTGQGMLTFTTCTPANMYPPPEAAVGPIGWPCLVGQSVGIPGWWAGKRRINVMVFQIPDAPTNEEEGKMRSFRKAVQFCQQDVDNPRLANPQAAERIDVTQLCICVWNAFGNMKGAKRDTRLRGVLAYPVYDPTAGAEQRRFEVGIAAPEGLLVEDSILVPARGPRSPIRSFSIVVVSTFAGTA